MPAIKNGWKNDVSHYANLDLHSAVGKNHTNSKFRTIQICTKQGLTVSKVTILKRAWRGKYLSSFPPKNWPLIRALVRILRVPVLKKILVKRGRGSFLHTHFYCIFMQQFFPEYVDLSKSSGAIAPVAPVLTRALTSIWDYELFIAWLLQRYYTMAKLNSENFPKTLILTFR